MKTNRVPDFPEKVYIPRDTEYPQSPDIWWEKESSEGNIEYTRTDAFIEKACEKLEKCMYDNLMFQGRLHREEVINNFVEDFKKHMEG